MEANEKVKLLSRDLRNGREYPRSPRETLGGYALAARAVDKCRAVLAGQSSGHRQTRLKTSQGSLARRWREIFRRRRRRHDPMLVLNMSIFNSADGWNRTFNPIKAHEDGF